MPRPGQAWRTKPPAPKPAQPAKARKPKPAFVIVAPARGQFPEVELARVSSITQLRQQFNQAPHGTIVLIRNAVTGFAFTANTSHALDDEDLDYLVDGLRTPEGDWYLPSNHRRHQLAQAAQPSLARPVKGQEVSPMSTPSVPTFVPDVTLFADGACSGNPGPAAFAAILITGQVDDKAAAELARALKKSPTCKAAGHSAKAITGFIGDGTNNTAELSAVLAGLRAITKPCTVQVLTDSTNVIGWLSLGYKAKVTRIAALRDAIATTVAEKGLTVEYVHVDGHAGNPLNEAADTYAKRAVDAGKAGTVTASPLI